MKRHLLEARRSYLWATATGLCVLGLAAGLTTASAAPGKTSERENTFLTSIVSGTGANGWAARSNWQSVFRLNRPGLFGVEQLTTSPVFYQVNHGVLLQAGSVVQGSPVASGIVKSGGGTLQLANTATYFGNTGVISVGRLQAGNPSGDVLNVSSSSTSTPIVVTPVTQTSPEAVETPSAEAAAATSAPIRRPKPPIPTTPPVVSR